MIVESIEEIADVLGVSRRTVVDWQAEGMPVQERGKRGVGSKFDTGTCVKWLIQREITKARVVKPSDHLAIAQAEKVEMENDERRGVLIVAAHVEPAMRAAIVSAREYLRSTQSDVVEVIRAAPGEGEALAALEDRDNAFLRRMADWPNTQACADALDEL